MSEPRLKPPEFDYETAMGASGGADGNEKHCFAEGAHYQFDIDQAHFTTTVTALMQVIEGLMDFALYISDQNRFDQPMPPNEGVAKQALAALRAELEK